MTEVIRRLLVFCNSEESVSYRWCYEDRGIMGMIFNVYVCFFPVGGGES